MFILLNSSDLLLLFFNPFAPLRPLCWFYSRLVMQITAVKGLISIESMLPLDSIKFLLPDKHFMHYVMNEASWLISTCNITYYKGLTFRWFFCVFSCRLCCLVRNQVQSAGLKGWRDISTIFSDDTKSAADASSPGEKSNLLTSGSRWENWRFMYNYVLVEILFTFVSAHTN